MQQKLMRGKKNKLYVEEWKPTMSDQGSAAQQAGIRS